MEYSPAPTNNWLAGPHVEPVAEVTRVVRREQPGVIPLWAGLGLLLGTAALVVLQLATGQYLLALLIALIGGIGATTLASSRSAPALFTGVLLIGALSVAMGVELVYLADHLRGGELRPMTPRTWMTPSEPRAALMRPPLPPTSATLLRTGSAVVAGSSVTTARPPSGRTATQTRFSARLSAETRAA